MFAGCATADDPTGGSPDDVAPGDVSAGGGVAQPQDDGADDTSTTAQLSGTEPLITSNGSSSATVMPSSSAGASLAMHGGREQGSYLIASYSAPTSGGDATGEFTVTPRGDAAFEYSLRGTGGGYSSRQIHLEREPGSTALEVLGPGGITACGDIPSDTPTPVAVVFHAASQTFDVLIGGAATACTGFPTRMSAPVVGFRVMDGSFVGHGGEVEFTGLAVR